MKKKKKNTYVCLTFSHNTADKYMCLRTSKPGKKSGQVVLCVSIDLIHLSSYESYSKGTRWILPLEMATKYMLNTLEEAIVYDLIVNLHCTCFALKD